MKTKFPIDVTYVEGDTENENRRACDISDEDLEASIGGKIEWGSGRIYSHKKNVVYQFQKGDHVRIRFLVLFTRSGIITERKTEENDYGEIYPVYHVKLDHGGDLWAAQEDISY